MIRYSSDNRLRWYTACQWAEKLKHNYTCDQFHDTARNHQKQDISDRVHTHITQASINLTVTRIVLSTNAVSFGKDTTERAVSATQGRERDQRTHKRNWMKQYRYQLIIQKSYAYWKLLNNGKRKGRENTLWSWQTSTQINDEVLIIDETSRTSRNATMTPHDSARSSKIHNSASRK